MLFFKKYCIINVVILILNKEIKLLKEAYDTSTGKTPVGELTTITCRCGINKINQDAEGHPCKILQSY